MARSVQRICLRPIYLSVLSNATPSIERFGARDQQLSEASVDTIDFGARCNMCNFASAPAISVVRLTLVLCMTYMVWTHHIRTGWQVHIVMCLRPIYSTTHASLSQYAALPCCQ